MNVFNRNNKEEIVEESNDIINNVGINEGFNQEIAKINEIPQTVNETIDIPVENVVQEVGIGGGGEPVVVEEKTQMEKDALKVKENANLIIPLRGVVTSRFGLRQSTEIVSSNHTGIDIGANTGTVIVSSMDGKVVDITNDEYYGNYLKIQNGEVLTLYAHCKTIYVKKGETVKQGQHIAEVGISGKTTGPHLHFEIRVQDRLINPEMVLDF